MSGANSTENNNSSSGSNNNNMDGFEWDPTQLFTESGDLSEGFDVLPSLEDGMLPTGTNTTYSSMNNRTNHTHNISGNSKNNTNNNNNSHEIKVQHQQSNQNHPHQSQILSQVHHIPLTTQLGMESYIRGREGTQINNNKNNYKNLTTSLTASLSSSSTLLPTMTNTTESGAQVQMQDEHAQEYYEKQRISQMGLKLSASVSSRSGVKNTNSLLENAAKKNSETLANVANNKVQTGSHLISDNNFDEQSLGSFSSGDEGDDQSRMNASNSNMKAKAKNREHARNTRKRKKVYIENLRETLNSLLSEREQQDRDRRVILSRLVEFDHVRKQVLQTFFYYRSCNERSFDKWSHIMADEFVIKLPVTPYRSFPAHQVKDGVRNLTTIDDICKDTASLHVMAQNIGQIPAKAKKPVEIVYYVSAQDIIMQNSVYMCRWVMKTENAVENGAVSECSKRGMLKAVFNTVNKLTRLDITFDVMSFMQEIRRSSGEESFPIVPNNSEIAVDEMDVVHDARIITEASRPFAITRVNKSWEKLCGYTESEVIGKDCSFLQGDSTEHGCLQKLKEAVKMGHAHQTVLTNYKKSGAAFFNFLRLYPLYNNGNELSHYLGILGDANQAVKRPQPVL